MTSAHTTILDLLAAGKIRLARSVPFTAEKAAGYFCAVRSMDEIPALVTEQEESYLGSLFLRFDEKVPDTVPQDIPAHCWAIQVCLQTAASGPYTGATFTPIGAIVTWSSAENEAEWQASRRPLMSFDDFQAARRPAHRRPIKEVERLAPP